MPFSSRFNARRRPRTRPALLENLESRAFLSVSPLGAQPDPAPAFQTIAVSANAVVQGSTPVGQLATIVLAILPADQSATLTLHNELIAPGGLVPRGTVVFGDGSTGAAQFIRANSRIVVFGQHVYSRPGTFTAYSVITAAPGIPDGYTGPPVLLPAIIVNVGAFGATVPIGGTTSVITVTPLPTPAFVEDTLGGEIAQLTGPSYRLPTEAGPGLAVRVSLNWGDGTVEDASLFRGADGNIHVSAFHAYRRPGTFAMVATLISVSNDPAALVPAPQQLTAQRIDVQLNSATGRTLHTTPGNAFTSSVGSLGNFGFVAAPAGQLTLTRAASGSNPAVVLKALILWGDGTTSMGLFKSNASGGFDVLGTHAYSTEGTYRIRVLLTPSYDNGATFAPAFITLNSLALNGRVPLTFPLMNFHASIPID